MRILFNHGMTPSEIYTNTPKRVIDRKWRWFISRYGSTNSYSDAISDPFKYCFGLMLNKVLDEKVRFRIPYAHEAYIDFEIVTDDDFVKHRQNGRFQNIDFVESDFTGYALRYYFKTRSYQKSYPVYLGGDLKKKFLKNINSGVNYYTTKDLTLPDLLDEVCDKFKDLTRKEVNDLLVHGFRRLHTSMKFGCAITINTTKFFNCYAYIGDLALEPAKQIREYSKRRDRKLRKIESWKKLPFDGYYYIGLTEKVLPEWIEANKKSRTLIKFTKVIPRKIMDELFYKAPHIYIFRIKLKKFKGWAHWAEDLKARDTTFMGESINHKFIPSDKTWKEIMKEYETREC